MDLDSRIRSLCSSKNISIRQLAIKIGIAEQTLHRNLKRGSMETKYLEEMAKIFGISPSEILNLNSEPNIIKEPETKFTISDKEKDYTALLEELREVSREHREMCKKVIDLEEEIRQLKIERSDQIKNQVAK